MIYNNNDILAGLLHLSQYISILLGIPDNHTNLLQLMETIGGPVTSLEPDQIIMITQAGSFMYGLSTPTSDVDYLVIYADKTEVNLR